MAELEKVIKGLRCLSNPYIQDMDERDCDNCQYDNACCFLDVTADALSLLKAQEPRVMTLEEAVRADICFVEFKGGEPSPAFVSVATYSWLSEPIYRLQFANSYSYSDITKQGKQYRIWSARPTDEQRKTVKWE